MRKIAFPTLFYILAIHYSIKYTQKKEFRNMYII